MFDTTAINTGPVYESQPGGSKCFQVKLGGTSGAVSATVELYATNDPYCLISQDNCAKYLLNTYSLLGTAGASTEIAADSNYISTNVPWRFFWFKCTAITGTGAKISAWMNQ